MDKRFLLGACLLLGCVASFIVMPEASALFHKSVKGNNKKICVTRKVSDFDAIQTRGMLDLEISSHGKPSVVVSGDSNIVPLVRTKVRRHVLYITERHISFSTKHVITVKVVMPELKRLTQRGAGDVVGKNVNAKELKIYRSGAGALKLDGKIDLRRLEALGAGEVTITGIKTPELFVHSRSVGSITLSGEAKQLHVMSSGVGALYARNLKTKKANVELEGIGNVEVFVTDTLKAAVRGMGHIYYAGNPNKVLPDVFGLGGVAPLDE